MKHRLNDLTNVLHRPVETAGQSGQLIFQKPDVLPKAVRLNALLDCVSI
jgi:hypothetical protein